MNEAGAAAPALIIVPAFNEEACLAYVLGRLREVCPHDHVLVVDDGSRDRTADIARDLGARVVSHPQNRGYGAALVSGYRYAREHDYDLVCQVDADGQHDPAQLGLLRDELAKGEADAVFGSRMIAGGGHEQTSLPRFLGIHFFALVGRRLTGRAITDSTSGFAALNRRAVAFLERNTPDDYPDVNVLVAMHFAGIVATEVPVKMSARRAGESSLRGLGPFLYVPRMFYYLYQLRATGGGGRAGSGRRDR